MKGTDLALIFLAKEAQEKLRRYAAGEQFLRGASGNLPGCEIFHFTLHTPGNFLNLPIK